MALQAPVVSGVSPVVNDTDVVLRPTITIVVGGQSLVDPLTWGNQTFALYGPGDVVLESGPGSILNSGIADAPFPLLDGALRRDQIVGAYSTTISGANGVASGIGDALAFLASSGLVLLQFAPGQPLLPNTEYTAVLIGDDNAGLFFGGLRRFEGLTSYTSASGFAQSGVAPGVTSGFIKVAHPYSKTLETGEHVSATGQNDTYTITIVSGSNTQAVQGTAVSGFKYQWSQSSTPGTFSVTVSGSSDRNNLGNGLQIDFNGTFASGEVHELKVYIPKPLATSHVWKFSTGAIGLFTTPPVEPENIAVVIDETEAGGFGVDTTTELSGSQLFVVSTCPANLDYAVDEGIPFLSIEFNKVLNSGVWDPANVSVKSQPLLGIGAEPGLLSVQATVSPAMLETSGVFLKIWL